jgi:hypothetical protein
MSERKKKAISLLQDFIKEMDSFLKSLGDMSLTEDQIGLAHWFLSCFRANLISIENHWGSNDTLSATLIQRFNHEMLRDFFYVFGSPNPDEKVNEFFSFPQTQTENPHVREWRVMPSGKKPHDFIPPWISNEKTTKDVWRTVSNLAHPNIVSMRLHRGTQESKDYVMENATSLMVNDIAECLLYKPFRDLIFDTDASTANFCDKIRTFKNRASEVLFM